MSVLEKTDLEIIDFGDKPEDKFYCLIDLQISPDGLDIEKIKMSDPRNFDLEMRESGCLMMFTGDEIEELTSRGDLDGENLHESLVELALKEGVIKKT